MLLITFNLLKTRKKLKTTRSHSRHFLHTICSGLCFTLKRTTFVFNLFKHSFLLWRVDDAITDESITDDIDAACMGVD